MDLNKAAYVILQGCCVQFYKPLFHLSTTTVLNNPMSTSIVYTAHHQKNKKTGCSCSFRLDFRQRICDSSQQFVTKQKSNRCVIYYYTSTIISYRRLLVNNILLRTYATPVGRYYNIRFSVTCLAIYIY